MAVHKRLTAWMERQNAYRVVAVDEEGRPCSTTAVQQKRWKRHFSKVLNVPSQFDEVELQRVKQRPHNEELGHPPTKSEVRRALGKLKNGKAPGSSNILPEIVKAGRCNEEFVEMVWDVVSSVWQERAVPKDWVDAIIVPIPKKGNLRSCDNWRGIALLEVVGKMVARIVQGRLQRLAERELQDSVWV